MDELLNNHKGLAEVYIQTVDDLIVKTVLTSETRSRAYTAAFKQIANNNLQKRPGSKLEILKLHIAPLQALQISAL